MYPRLLELPWTVPLLGQLTIYTYGVLLAAAYLLGLKLAMVRAQARGLDAAKVLGQIGRASCRERVFGYV